MAWTDSVDIYCERLGPEFWAEPINAVSNLAFIVAAVVGFREARRLGWHSAWITVLCVLAASIGVGSFLFHTFAQRWAGLADVIPILLFILTYLFAASHFLFGLRWRIAVPAAIVAFGLALLARNGVLMLASKEQLNGSEGYAPALALLVGSAIILMIMRRPAAKWIGAAAAVFVASLGTRIADSHACGALPFGTHFLWHTLNGLMIGILLLAIIRHGRLARGPSGTV